MTEELEKLKQENYSLKKEVQRQKDILAEYDAELQSWQQKSVKHEKGISDLEAAHREELRLKDCEIYQWMEVTKAKDVEIAGLKATVEKREKEQQSLKEELARMEESYLNQSSEERMETCLTDTKEQRDLALQQLEELRRELCEVKELNKVLRDENVNLKETVAALEGEVASCQNSEIEWRAAASEMRLEIEKKRFTDEKPAAKGNSLFSEVNDQRVKVEHELIRYRAENEFLKEKYRKLKLETNQLKVQAAKQWEMLGTNFISAREKILETSWNEAKRELRLLNQRLEAAESRHAKEQQNLVRQFDGSISAGFIHYMEQKMTNQLRDLQKERMQRLLLAEQITELQTALLKCQMIVSKSQAKLLYAASTDSPNTSLLQPAVENADHPKQSSERDKSSSENRRQLEAENCGAVSMQCPAAKKMSLEGQETANRDQSQTSQRLIKVILDD